MAGTGSKMERRLEQGVCVENERRTGWDDWGARPRVDGGAGIQKKARDLQVPFARGDVQCGSLLTILEIDVQTGRQQTPQVIDFLCTHYHMQQGLMRRPAAMVDIEACCRLGSKQCLCTAAVAVLYGVVQRTLVIGGRVDVGTVCQQ